MASATSKGRKLRLFDGYVVGLRLQDAAGEEELFRKLLVPLLTEIGRGDDQYPPLPLGPDLRKNESRLDGLAEADLIRKYGPLGKRRSECE